jgi:hypothetical protein
MNTREEIESNVCAVNSVLKEKVRQMPIIELLRNAHPAWRSDYAHRLFAQNIITKEEAQEFTKLF